MYSYVVRMSLLYVCKLSVCTRMLFVYHSYVIRMSLVCRFTKYQQTFCGENLPVELNREKYKPQLQISYFQN